MRRFSGWHEPIAAVVEAADDGAILRNDVYYVEPLARWKHKAPGICGGLGSSPLTESPEEQARRARAFDGRLPPRVRVCLAPRRPHPTIAFTWWGR